MKFLHNISVLVLLSTLGGTFGATAWGSDFQSPRTAGLGGSGHAGPLLNDAIYLNPSFVSFLPSYSVGLNWETFSTPNDSSHGRVANLSIQDGRSELFQAGAGYTLREDGTWIHVGASRSVVKRLGVGLGGKFYFNNPRLQNGQDLTFSTSAIATDEIQTALIVDNILESSAGKSRDLYREFTLGTKFNLKGILLLYADPHIVPNRLGTKYGYEAGAELVVFNDFFFRTGYFRNSNVPAMGIHGRGWGAGLGWIAPRISFDYSIQRVLEPVFATQHSFGATMYF